MSADTAQTKDPVAGGEGIARRLAEHASGLRYETLPAAGRLPPSKHSTRSPTWPGSPAA